MIVLISFACLASGVGFACASLNDPTRAARLERWAGVCVVAGLSLLGVSLKLGQ